MIKTYRYLANGEDLDGCEVEIDTVARSRRLFSIAGDEVSSDFDLPATEVQKIIDTLDAVVDHGLMEEV